MLLVESVASILRHEDPWYLIPACPHISLMQELYRPAHLDLLHVSHVVFPLPSTQVIYVEVPTLTAIQYAYHLVVYGVIRHK